MSAQGARIPTPAQAQCGQCGLTFASVSGFDSHRVGELPRRRCQSPTELVQGGLIDFSGVWGPAEYAVTLDRLASARSTRARHAS